ncbi:ATR-interacting protein [Megalops cyprinoides]|uniref:ATR-interacting protein n=1 Tax=Megalops cyprinoides TaxID=118141 RepID=UPI0018641F4B|nr:ATR-interacting protein [Megalops cyprinoides]
MECPPSKRLKGMNFGAPPSADPFEDDEAFTQDDLDEIDIIASQACTGDVGVTGPRETLGAVLPCPGPQNKAFSEGRKTFALGASNKTSSNPGQSNMGCSHEFPPRQGFGNEQKCRKDREVLSCGSLEAQQTELKKKLKEVEEQLLLKDGEIRVLRDSIKHSQQEREQQRQAQLLVEQERAHAQSEKERELLKKVQSLQSELHFKEAEMNEIKSKLMNSERGGKRIASSSSRNSGTSPGVSPFLTKQSFAAQLTRWSSPVKPCQNHCRDDGKRFASETNNANNDVQADALPSPDTFCCQESVLLTLLLQHPLDPSTLGLCHLLCISPDALPGFLLQHSYLSSGSSVGSSSSSTETKAVHRPQSGFSQAQSLAMSGLNMLALARYLPRQNTADPGAQNQQTSSRRCPGAVHLLPLLEYHIGLFCQALGAVDSSGQSPLRGSSLSGTSSEGSMASSVEDTLGTLEEFALAALRAVHHLVSHSPEVVHTLLSRQPQEGPDAGGEVHHPLFSKLLQLADPAFTSAASRREKVLTVSLTALASLAERAGDELLGRFKFVVKSQSMARCLSMDSSYRTVCLYVSLLALTVTDDEVAAQLCSQLDVCPLLKIFQYITSRPDNTATESQWSQLEVEVVRFLTKLFTHKTSTWTVFTESSCQCNNEVVRTLVALLHRQWLEVRRWECQEGRDQAWAGPGVHLLREALMLLHWLLLNDTSFSEHCLDVLHMYDQVIPAIRDTFRKIPCLTESEELALEELCRPEAEDLEDMDMDTGS